jgi:hypothetical protein
MLGNALTLTLIKEGITMTNGGGQHEEKKVDRKEPKTTAGKPIRGQVNRPSSGK